MMLRNTQLATFLLRGLSIAAIGLTLTAPTAYAADKVSLTLYNGQHKEVGDELRWPRLHSGNAGDRR